MRRLLSFAVICAALSCSGCAKEVCNDTCYWAMDGECDDGGENALNDFCELGTDCGDCGARTIK